MDRRENHSDEATLDGIMYPGFTVYRPLSERDALIIEMYDEGLSTYEIAEALEINRHTISKVLKENEVETRTIADYHKLKHDDIIELFKQGKTKHEIAKDLGFSTVEQKFKVSRLIQADELFFTGTAAEITPIREVDGNIIRKGKPGPITKAIQDIYFKAIRGQLKKYRKWLDYL